MTLSQGQPFNPRGDDVNVRSAPQMLEYEAIADRIAADRPARILDWGCGYGQISAMLHDRGLEVASFEYSPTYGGDGVVQQPLERYPHLTVYASGDARRLPFGDAAFSAVLSCGVLEHVQDPDASLDEIRRVLEPGGVFYVFKLPNRLSYLEFIARHTGMYYHGIAEDDRLYDQSSATDLVQRHGFTIEELRQMNMLPLTITGRLATRAARTIWSANKALSRVPLLNLVSTNIELVARAPADA